MKYIGLIQDCGGHYGRVRGLDLAAFFLSPAPNAARFLCDWNCRVSCDHVRSLEELLKPVQLVLRVLCSQYF